MTNNQKPGEIPHRPGEFIERGPRGGEVPNPRQITIEPGDKPLPPTQAPGRTWQPIPKSRGLR
jgi:hypothetical protein